MKLIILLSMAIIANKTLTIKSPAFLNDEFIPEEYTCKGANVSPELNISGIPEAAVSLALVMDDPDAPMGTFDHWVMWNIPVTDKIEKNSSPGIDGKNGKEGTGYTGPCPPSGIHHYNFRIYALDVKLDIEPGSDKAALLKAMDGHILAFGELTGLFKK